VSWYLMAFKKYFEFSGRARRKEYWMFVLFNFIVGLIIGFFKLHVLILVAYQIFVLIPTFSLAVRRCHDVDHKGWWILLPIYNFVLMCYPGNVGANRFGPDPKATTPAA
jgi:uncharacterized membrane protein YhaH (DUF805 family)